jgi:hypothetical protein
MAAMQLNKDIMQSVEALGYRVTVGDVAARTGLNLGLAEQGLLTLAAATQAHMQVAESGDIAYEFSRNFRGILRNQYWQLRAQELWSKVWRVLFYLIRISFGIVLLASIVIMITAIILLQSAQQNDRDDRRDGGGMVFLPRLWLGPNWFYWLDFGYGTPRRQRPQTAQGEKLKFLEAIFSFLFGDGDPNANLEERRWGAIATVIRNQRGTATAEQIAPYLDDLGKGWSTEFEDYILPTLTRFNGQPKVTPQGDLIYYFPELQITATAQKKQPVASYLKETRRQFSAASSNQILLAAGLGCVNFVAALILGGMLQDPTAIAQISGFIGFVQSIYWFLWGYGAAFLGIPLIRYIWLQQQNRRIDARNQARQARAEALLQAAEPLPRKLAYAQQFASETVLQKETAIYSTETDLLDQEIQQRDQLDAEWQRRLEQSS